MQAEQVELIAAAKTDAQKVYDSWGRNAANFTYLSAPPQACVEDAQVYLARILMHPQDIAFHIRLKASGQIAGLIKARVEGHKALVGYVVDQSCWGRGVATQALRQLIPILLQGKSLSRLWATCATDNPASARVLEKCGFVREGRLKNWIVYPAQGEHAHDNFSYVYAATT